MLDFDDIAKFYPASMQGFKRNMLREYLQYKILAAIFSSPYASKVSFIGGTALCLVHKNPRFSEDIDFDNFDISEADFDALANYVQKKLVTEGFLVEIRMVHKGAYRCYIRFPELLFKMGLTPIEEEKVLIQIDTAPHHFKYNPEPVILNKFDVFTNIRVTPLDLLLSQKFFAARDRKTPKGRDFFDIVFLLAKTKPNYSYLAKKMNIANAKELRQEFGEFIKTLDFNWLAKDVEKFLFVPSESERVRLFSDFFKQAELE